MYVSDDYKFIFYYYPKTGGSSIITSIEPISRFMPDTQSKASHAEEFPHYFKFYIVRHPVDILTDLYHEKSALNPEMPDFSEWVTLSGFSPPILLPLNEFGKHADFYMYYEQLEDEFKYLKGILNMPSRTKEPKKRKDLPRGKITYKARDKILDFYGGDFEVYGYDIDF